MHGCAAGADAAGSGFAAGYDFFWVCATACVARGEPEAELRCWIARDSGGEAPFVTPAGAIPTLGNALVRLPVEPGFADGEGGMWAKRMPATAAPTMATKATAAKTRNRGERRESRHRSNGPLDCLRRSVTSVPKSAASGWLTAFLTSFGSCFAGRATGRSRSVSWGCDWSSVSWSSDVH